MAAKRAKKSHRAKTSSRVSTPGKTTQYHQKLLLALLAFLLVFGFLLYKAHQISEQAIQNANQPIYAPIATSGNGPSDEFTAQDRQIDDQLNTLNKNIANLDRGLSDQPNNLQ